MPRARRELRKVVISRESVEESSTSEEEEPEEEEDWGQLEEAGEERTRGIKQTGGRHGGQARSVCHEDLKEVEEARKAKTEDQAHVGDEASGSEEENGEENEVPDVSIKPLRVARARHPIKISLKSSTVCKVCKSMDHAAGFVGSVYLDCPNRPCYLCKQPGHTTATCPHRVDPDHVGSSVPAGGKRGLVRCHRPGGARVLRCGGRVLKAVHLREIQADRLRGFHSRRTLPSYVENVVAGLHDGRITALEFHPTRDDLVITADKRGHVGLCSYEFLGRESKSYDSVHHYSVSALRVRGARDGMEAYTASLDGTVCKVDLETGHHFTLTDLNPQGWQGELDLGRSFYAMDVNEERHAIIAGDDIGRIHILDDRCSPAHNGQGQGGSQQVLEGVHKRRTKIVSVQCNPVDCSAVVSAGNDRTACIWHLRHVNPPQRLACFLHPRAVNSAYFSPVTGTKLLTTCQDNRLRVWDSIVAAGGGDQDSPSRCIVHSHDFKHYLSPFRAVWDPKDEEERVFACGRYISDDYNGMALRPVDLFDGGTGTLLAALMDPILPYISPVVMPHPRLDILATGSSRRLYFWKVWDDGEADEEA